MTRCDKVVTLRLHVVAKNVLSFLLCDEAPPTGGVLKGLPIGRGFAGRKSRPPSH